MSIRLSFAIAGALVALGATQALADPATADRDAKSVRVSTADLNLNTAADTKVLFRRIHSAADQVCGIMPTNSELTMMRVHNACVAEIVDRTIAGANLPGLTALNTQSRQPATTLASTR